MELTTTQVEVQAQVKAELLRELADVELALIGGGMGSVLFDDD